MDLTLKVPHILNLGLKSLDKAAKYEAADLNKDVEAHLAEGILN